MSNYYLKNIMLSVMVISHFYVFFPRMCFYTCYFLLTCLSFCWLFNMALDQGVLLRYQNFIINKLLIFKSVNAELHVENILSFKTDLSL